MISDERLSASLNFLVTSADELAAARASLTAIETGMKGLKAKLMRESDGKSIADREADALCHPDYNVMVEGLVEATKIVERLRLKRENALTFIETWRTIQANHRAAERIR